MQQPLCSLIDAAAMVNIDGQNDQACVLKVTDKSIITDAISPEARQASGEGFAPVPGAIEGRDRSKCATDTSGGLGISFLKPLHRVGRKIDFPIHSISFKMLASTEASLSPSSCSTTASGMACTRPERRSAARAMMRCSHSSSDRSRSKMTLRRR